MSFKPIDPKRDEIRRYLERGNVMDSLTKLFIRVIKERPDNPMEYIQNNIGVVRHQHDKYERLQKDLQKANEEIQRLRDIINSINPEVLQNNQYITPAEKENNAEEKPNDDSENSKEDDQTNEISTENPNNIQPEEIKDQQEDVQTVDNTINSELNVNPSTEKQSTDTVVEK